MSKETSYRVMRSIRKSVPTVGYVSAGLMWLKLAIVWYLSGASFLIVAGEEAFANVAIIIAVLLTSMFFDSMNVNKEVEEELQKKKHL